jgi:uncharacterized protein (TIGR02145 family)
MKEECEPYGTNTIYQGKSNTITTAKRPGFESLLAGYADVGPAYDYGSYGYFWSASSYSSTYAWNRTVGSSYSQVNRNNYARYGLFSVRCKKVP